MKFININQLKYVSIILHVFINKLSCFFIGHWKTLIPSVKKCVFATCKIDLTICKQIEYNFQFSNQQINNNNKKKKIKYNRDIILGLE